MRTHDDHGIDAMTAAKDHRLALEARGAQLWSEDIKRARGADLTLDAASYNRWVDEVMPWTSKMEATDLTCANGLRVVEFPDAVRVGDAFTFVMLLVPTHVATVARNGAGTGPGQRFGLELGPPSRDRGMAYFTGPVRVPALYDRMQRVWMSLTPMEILTQRPGLRKARGRVLVGGCGLGWFARRCLEKPGVTSVTIVDRDNDVLDYFGRKLLPVALGLQKKLTLVCADAYEQAHAPYDSYLFDIWEGHGQAVHDRQFQSLKRTRPNVWGWGDSRSRA